MTLDVNSIPLKELKGKQRGKDLLQDMINEPLIKPGNEEKLCFQRHIGAIEIYNGHKISGVSYVQ